MALTLVRSLLPHRRMDWWADERISVRLYDWKAARLPAFCAAEMTAFYAILRGELEVDFGPARQRVRATEGEACLVVGGTPHLYQVAAGTRFVAADLPARGAPGVLHGALTANEGRMFAAAYESRTPDALAAVHHAAERIAARAREVALSRAHSTARLLEVKRRLEEGSGGPLALSEVARELRLDPAYLSREFRANFGGTPREYVRLLRMERFLRSLRRARSLTRIAVDAGFGDYPTLCRMTAKWFGAPPSRLLVGTSNRSETDPAPSDIPAA